MASSTTIPVARTTPNRVRIFMVKPKRYITKKVPINEMGMAIIGIKVVRQFRRKIKITRTTSINARRMVSSTSEIALRIFIVES